MPGAVMPFGMPQTNAIGPGEPAMHADPEPGDPTIEVPRHEVLVRQLDSTHLGSTRLGRRWFEGDCGRDSVPNIRGQAATSTPPNVMPSTTICNRFLPA